MTPVRAAALFAPAGARLASLVARGALLREKRDAACMRAAFLDALPRRNVAAERVRRAVADELALLDDAIAEADAAVEVERRVVAARGAA